MASGGRGDEFASGCLHGANRDRLGGLRAAAPRGMGGGLRGLRRAECRPIDDAALVELLDRALPVVYDRATASERPHR